MFAQEIIACSPEQTRNALDLRMRPPYAARHTQSHPATTWLLERVTLLCPTYRPLLAPAKQREQALGHPASLRPKTPALLSFRKKMVFSAPGLPAAAACGHLTA